VYLSADTARRRHYMQECLTLPPFSFPGAYSQYSASRAVSINSSSSQAATGGQHSAPNSACDHTTPAVMAESQQISGNYYDALTVGGSATVVAGNVQGDVHFNAVKPEGSLPEPQQMGEC
jgi:hypothetical protein